ncbi:hypothetical protein GCK32_000117 [Trichostrongylus colubriformis]|uniref:Uncharacterized protein n=1 Tax=Trichostrongylus colubriformis TaxID=6319 RepID=A0AAN8FHK1_TRICO
MPTSDGLEERLRRELDAKIAFVQSAPCRPTEPLIQQKIKEFGQKSHEWIETIKQARYEYINLIQDRADLVKAGRSSPLSHQDSAALQDTPGSDERAPGSPAVVHHCARMVRDLGGCGRSQRDG